MLAVVCFSQEFIYTEKVFTVDFKRPASGTYNLNLDLTDDQYIQKFQHDVTDTTIADVTALVGKLVPASGLRGLTSASRAEDYYTEIQSVVAVGMFEVDAPDFEEQMTAFINCHLNQAHDAWVAPPSVQAVHRTGLYGFAEQSNICEGLVVPDNSPLREVPLCAPPCKPQPGSPSEAEFVPDSSPTREIPPVTPQPDTLPPPHLDGEVR